jgi:hypothetical protein
MTKLRESTSISKIATKESPNLKKLNIFKDEFDSSFENLMQEPLKIRDYKMTFRILEENEDEKYSTVTVNDIRP